MQSSITCDTQYKFLYYDQYSVKMVYTVQCIILSVSLSDRSFDIILQIPRNLPLICAHAVFDGTLPSVLNEMKKNQRLNQIIKREPLKNQS